MDRSTFYSEVAELADKNVADVSRTCKAAFYLLKTLNYNDLLELLTQVEDTKENLDQV